MEYNFIKINNLLQNEEDFMLFCNAIHHELDPYNTGSIFCSKLVYCMTVMSSILENEKFSKYELEKVSKLLDLDMTDDDCLNLDQFCKIVRIILENHLSDKLMEGLMKGFSVNK
jgi:hypothetical protein